MGGDLAHAIRRKWCKSPGQPVKKTKINILSYINEPKFVGAKQPFAGRI